MPHPLSAPSEVVLNESLSPGFLRLSFHGFGDARTDVVEELQPPNDGLNDVSALDAKPVPEDLSGQVVDDGQSELPILHAARTGSLAHDDGFDRLFSAASEVLEP